MALAATTIVLIAGPIRLLKLLLSAIADALEKLPGVGPLVRTLRGSGGSFGGGSGREGSGSGSFLGRVGDEGRGFGRGCSWRCCQ